MLEEYKRQNFNNKESLEISNALVPIFKRRRTIRNFSSEEVNKKVIENAIRVASLSPSGANRQPWSFALISSNKIKQQIRQLAEKQEKRFYKEKPNKKWVADLKHLNVNEEKEFLTTCPYLIVIFYGHFDMEGDEKKTNYYAKESTGIATGMLISALHMSGLSTLTYTPKHMNFLTELLGRPKTDKPFMLLGVGLPEEDAKVPVLKKKTLEQVLKVYQ